MASGIAIDHKLAETANHPPDTQARMVWRQFKRHKLALAGVIFLAVMIVTAVLGTWIMPHDPLEQNPGYSKGMPQPPTMDYLMGTDTYGRDILSRLINGAQISLSVGFVAVGISAILGLIMGSLAGFYGGLTDTIITRTADVFLSVPSFFLMMTANAYLEPSIYNVMIIIGLFNWMTVARLVRSEFLRLKESDFIQHRARWARRPYS